MCPNTEGWVNCFLVEVQIIDFIFETKSSSLAVPGVDCSLTFGYFILGVLGERLVVGFLGGIFLFLARD
jgi:hypothetical protein